MKRKVEYLASISILETLSFLVLLAMMFLRSETGISVAGMIHGLLFLGYMILVIRDREDYNWTWSFVAVAILTGPVGAIIVLERLRRDGLLARA
ncbi:MAG: DUF3817 domain-containing protein [Actinomycetota bacterium]